MLPEFQRVTVMWPGSYPSHIFGVRFLPKLGRGLARGLFLQKIWMCIPPIGAGNDYGVYRRCGKPAHRITCQPLVTSFDVNSLPLEKWVHFHAE